MKFLHTADLHLGRFLDNRPRWEEQAAMLDEIADLARQEQVDLILVAGDVFDSFVPPARAEELFFDFAARVSRAGQILVAIAGNHDQPQRLAAAAPLAVSGGVYLLGLPGQESLSFTCRDDMTVKLAALPYVSEARAQELFSGQLDDERESSLGYRECLARQLTRISASFQPHSANLVLAHLFVNGSSTSDSERPLPAQVGGSFGVDGQIFPAGADYIALGHLHRPQQLIAAAPCRYAGSPLAYSFSEADQQKSVTVGEISLIKGEKHTELRVVPLHAGRPLTRWHCDNYEQALSRCQDPAQADYWVQLTVELEHPLSGDQLDALYAAHPYLVGVDPCYPELVHSAQTAREAEELSILERFAAFARENEGAEPDEALLAAFTTLLNQEEGAEEE